MTPDDIAWVQGRLRGCKYLVDTLHKCAQCLDVGDDELLAALGFESEADLKAAYPSKLRGSSRQHLHHARREYDARGRVDVLRRHRHGCCQAADGLRWEDIQRGNHAALHELEGKEPRRGVPTAAQAGDPGTNTKKGEIKMNVDKKGLPAYCYAIAPKTGLPVRIFRGEHVMFGVRPDMMVSKANAQISVDARQAAAMVGGVLYGWDGPHADPAQYDDDGVYIGPQ